MLKDSFSDIDGKKGKVGSKVVEVIYGKEKDEQHTVKCIITKGRGGIRIYFNEGGFGKANRYRIIE